MFALSLPDGTGTAVAHEAVTGGTGRFEGATGEASGGGAGGMVTFDGWIRYDASQ